MRSKCFSMFDYTIEFYQFSFNTWYLLPTISVEHERFRFTIATSFGTSFLKWEVAFTITKYK